VRSTGEGTGEAWTRKHRSWLTSVRFADHASQATLADYLHAHDVLIARRDQVEADLAQLAVSAPCAHTVARLRCLRGIDTLTAVGLCAEIGEWERFDHPDQLASYLGIVPSEPPAASSGGWGRSPRPAPRTPADSWSRPPTTTAAGPWSAKRSSGANAGNHPRSSTSPGAHNAGSTPAGANSKTSAANPAGSSRSRSRASSPPTAGRSPPAPPHRRHRHPHQPPARGSPTHC
jgi:Transposase IS116/IS110/IS902 family